MGSFMVIFIILPLVALLLSESPQILLQTLKKSEVINAILLSIALSFSATFIACIFGIPLAYILARKSFYGKSIIKAFIDLPIVIPHTVAGIALLTVFSPEGFLGKCFSKIGINFVYTYLGIIVAMLFVSAPYLINIVREGIESIDENLEKISRSLGASQIITFFKIVLPLSKRHILTGCTMTWARAISEFGAIAMISYHPMVASVLIWHTFSISYHTARAIGIILLLICFVIFIILKFLLKNACSK